MVVTVGPPPPVQREEAMPARTDGLSFNQRGLGPVGAWSNQDKWFNQERETRGMNPTWGAGQKTEPLKKAAASIKKRRT